jgi:NAD(P)-dependent dehydrogenase (short-subunit alcohol dehydrogenase family)
MMGGRALETKIEDVMKMFQVVVGGPILLLQAAYEHMPKHSRVINVGSCATKMGFVQLPIYGAAKAAMDHLTFTLAHEVSYYSPSV